MAIPIHPPVEQQQHDQKDEESINAQRPKREPTRTVKGVAAVRALPVSEYRSNQAHAEQHASSAEKDPACEEDWNQTTSRSSWATNCRPLPVTVFDTHRQNDKGANYSEKRRKSTCCNRDD
jgi:hypothetical protein